MRTVLRLVTILSLFFSPLAFADGAIDTQKVNEVVDCSSDLIALPEPKAVFIDRAQRKVLFAVALEARRNYEVVTAPTRIEEPKANRAGKLLWSEKLAHENNFNLNRAGKDAIWIDVTSAFAPFARMFELYDGYENSAEVCNEQNCYFTAGYLLDVPDVSDMLTPKYYKKLGYKETESPDAPGTTLLYFGSLNRSAGWIHPVHAMIRIPGTDWIIHKNGGGTNPVMIQPTREGYGWSPGQSRLNKRFGLKPMAVTQSFAAPGVIEQDQNPEWRQASLGLAFDRIRQAEALKKKLEVVSHNQDAAFFCLSEQGAAHYGQINNQNSNPLLIFDWVHGGVNAQMPLRIVYAKKSPLRSLNFYSDGGARIFIDVPNAETAASLFASISESMFVLFVLHEQRWQTFDDPRVSLTDLKPGVPWRDRSGIMQGQFVRLRSGKTMLELRGAQPYDFNAHQLPTALEQVAAALTFTNGLRAATTSHAPACPR